MKTEMKKLLIVASTMALLATAVAPAQAGNDAGLIIGGVVGGLFLGEILNNNNRHRHQNVYIQEQPVYVQQCHTQWQEYYDTRGYIVRRPFHVCNWVRAR